MNPRYTPPNQRNPSLTSRKSPGVVADESEKAKNVDVDKNLGGNSGSNTFYPRLIPLHGCATSQASHLLHLRWKAAIDCYNDPAIDLSERPVMYTGSGASGWGNFRLPHQLMSGPQMDFLVKLEHAIHKSDANVRK